MIHKKNNLGALVRNIITSGMDEKGEIESIRRTVLLTIISITGVIFLVPLGMVAYVQGNSQLGLFDHFTAIILILNLVYLRSSGNYQFACVFGVTITGLLYFYLLVTGGVNNTAHVWYFTFPLFSSFLLGSKNGAIASILLLIAATIFFATNFVSPYITYYSKNFIIRFIPAYSVILIYSYAFEYLREKTQKELASNNEKLNRTVDELQETESKLRKTQKGLERRVDQRTAELLKSNISLSNKISEHSKAEEALRESEEKYRSMMESMKDAAYICSPELRIEYMNQAMVDRIGRDASGDICHKAIYDRHEKCSWCIFDQVQEKKHVEYEVTDPKDNRYYSVTNSPISHSDGKVSKLTIFRDITEIKDIEAQLQQSRKMESIGTLSGGIAHDFNNILSIIVGNTELALDDVPEWNPAHSNLKEVKTASLRATNIVKQLLSFSRKTDQNLQPIEIALVIKDALKFLRSTIPTTIDIQQDIQIKDETILADPTQINQIMMNLCINASHAMEQTGGNLTINVEKVSLDDTSDKVYPELRTGKHVKVTLGDTGPGIGPEIIDRIFDPYFTTKEVGKGSGMGLAVVLGIVKNHNGAITVDSTPGRGTTFNILFPVAEEKPEIKKDTSEELILGTETVLFVDDEKSIAEMAQKMFELGYQVKTAMSPQDALDQFSANPRHFDLVITDMTMPHMTGVALSEKIMEIRPDMPVIICTGYSALIDEERAKRLGIAAYVMKPLVMTEIAKTIRSVLDKNESSGQGKLSYS